MPAYVKVHFCATARFGSTAIKKKDQHPITPAQFIRQHIFRMPLTDFAALLGVTPTIISRYERAGKFPPHQQPLVLTLASKRGLKLQLKWFGKVPWDPRGKVPQ